MRGLILPALRSSVKGIFKSGRALYIMRDALDASAPDLGHSRHLPFLDRTGGGDALSSDDTLPFQYLAKRTKGSGRPQAGRSENAGKSRSHFRRNRPGLL